MLINKASYIFCCLYFVASFFANGQGDTKIISQGSYIIDMGVEPQTIGNGLKPYGLVYELVSEHKVPVLWSINPNKVIGTQDFEYDNANYQGGPFIIEAAFVTPAIEAVIADWEADGVQTVITTDPVEVPVYDYIVTAPYIEIFNENLTVGINYINENAGITNWGFVNNAGNIDACAGVYLLVNAKAIQAEQEDIYGFVTNGGNLFVQGKAASSMEALNASGGADLDFLGRGLRCYGLLQCGIGINHAETHAGPVDYDITLGKDPLMQFLGNDLHLATEKTGSGDTETWFLPLGLWETGTNLPLTTQDENISQAPGAKVAYGHAYGDEAYGRALYVGGDNLDDEDAPETARVAAQRLLLNMIMLTGIDQSGSAEIGGPEAIEAGSPFDFTATIDDVSATSYTWRVTTDGALTENDNILTFEPAASNSRYTVEISVVASDDCGRSAFATKTVTVYPINSAPQAVEDNVFCEGDNPLTIDVLANDTDQQPDDRLSISLVTGNDLPVNGTAEVSDNKIVYTGSSDTFIMDSLYYQVCDDGLNPLCSEARVVITNELMINTAPSVEDQSFSIIAGESTEICIVATDEQGDAMEITNLVYDGEGTITRDDTSPLCFNYVVDEEFFGTEQVQITVCDIRENLLCTETTITLNVSDLPNQPPIIEDQHFEAVAGMPTDICLVASDPEGEDLTMTLINPGNAFSDNSDTDLCFEFESTPDFSGTDEVTVEVCDLDPDDPLCTQAVISVVVGTPPILISKALTPDGDGMNDIFFIENIASYPNNTVYIYDRWGGLVFETRGYNDDTNNWTGQNGSKESPAGTYYYLVELPDAGEKFKGYVELVK